MNKKILAVAINMLLYRGTAVAATHPDPWRIIPIRDEDLLRKVTAYVKVK